MNADPTPTTSEADPMEAFRRSVLDQVAALPPIPPVVELSADQAQAVARALELAGGFRERIETDHYPPDLRYAQAWQLLGQELRDRARAAELAAWEATSQRNRAWIERAYTAESKRRQHARAQPGQQRPGPGEASHER
jgi:hypothetical protein